MTLPSKAFLKSPESEGRKEAKTKSEEADVCSPHVYILARGRCVSSAALRSTVGVRPLGDGCSLFGVVGRDKPLSGGSVVARKVVSYERRKQKQPNDNAHVEGKLTAETGSDREGETKERKRRVED